MRHHWLTTGMLIVILGLFSSLCWAAPQVAVTLKPIHSLVASLMIDVGEPQLLLPDGASPHTFQLKPSILKALKQADIIIWVGPELELFMVKPLEDLPAQNVIALIDTPLLTLLPLRHGRAWQHDHAHEHAANDPAHADIDPHIWLSTDNARVMVEYLTKILVQKDPQHQMQYQHNAQLLNDKLIALKTTLTEKLKPIEQQPFLVYHDGYQYFEHEFHLHGVGSIVINPHLPLSAHGLYAIKQLIAQEHVKCVFRETEFNTLMIQNSLSGTDVKIAELDPLGARIPKGPDNYQQTLLHIGETIVQCLQ